MLFTHSFCHKLSQIGISPTLDYVKKKRITMVNIIALYCIPFMLYFAISNTLYERYSLAIVNTTNIFASLITLVLQHYKKHEIAKISLILPSYICFLMGGMLYQNGGQYYIISILIIAMLLYDDYRIHIIASIFAISGVICIELYAPIAVIVHPLPKTRIIFNILTSLTFILIAINFYIEIIYNKIHKVEEQRLRMYYANQDKERIFSIIAHDIKSPFATLENLAGALHDKILNNEDSKDFIAQIYLKIKAQNKTLDDLLKWGSSNIKGATKGPSAIPIKPMAEKITLLFQEQLSQKELKININIPDGTIMYANVDHLTVILRNLISNAIKFSYNEGEISIYSTSDKNRTYIHIKDNGIGMNSLKLSLLFNEIQNRSLGTLNEPGSGLGLVLCRDLIEQNNGTISIDSKPRTGSLFSIGLPNNPLNNQPSLRRKNHRKKFGPL